MKRAKWDLARVVSGTKPIQQLAEVVGVCPVGIGNRDAPTIHSPDMIVWMLALLDLIGQTPT
jgi:hypothetical protein